MTTVPQNFIKRIFNRHTILITIFVYCLMMMASMVPLDFKVLNPFKKGLKDYDVTDLIFSKFKDKNAEFDDRIVLVNVGVPDRIEISNMLEVIQSYQPKVIGLDIHFEDFSRSETDSILRRSLHEHDNVILAKRLTNYDVESGTYNKLAGCHDYFCDSMLIAYTNFYGSSDMTIREFLPRQTVDGSLFYSLGTGLALQYDLTKVKALESRKDRQAINYIGDRDAFINIEKEDVLLNNVDLTQTFKDKIVMLGYLGTGDWSESVKDKFVTPMNPKLTTRSIPDMHGLTIHANIAHMILDETYINKLGPKSSIFLNFLLIFFMVAVFNRVYQTINPGYHKIIKVLQVILFAFLFLIVSFVMFYFNLKLELGVGIVGAVISWDAVKWYNYIFLKKQSFFKPK